MNMIAERKLAHFDQVYGDGSYYWRDPKRKMPHNLYTGAELIRKGAEAKRFRADWNGPIATFAAPPAKGAPASPDAAAAVKATIPYLHGYTVSYEYDAANGVYLRSMNGEPHVDAESGRTLSAANVIICYAEHRVVDKEGRRDVDLFGPGKGALLQGGTKRDIVWERKDGLIRAYEGGKELGWLPGQTWVQIVPTGGAATFE